MKISITKPDGTKIELDLDDMETEQALPEQVKEAIQQPPKARTDPRNRWTNRDNTTLISEYNKGTRISDIAQLLGRTNKATSQQSIVLRKKGLLGRRRAKRESTKKTIVVPQHRTKNILHRVDELYHYLKDNRGELFTPEQLAKHLGIDRSLIYPLKSKLKAKRGVDVAKVKGGVVFKYGKIKKRQTASPSSSERMHFIQDRVKYYGNQFGWSYEKAFRQGAQDWKQRKHTIGVSHPKAEFPIFYPLVESSIPILKSILADRIKRGKSLIYADVQTVPIVEDGWTPNLFEVFIKGFMARQSRIKEALGVKGKFKVELFAGARLLTLYKGGE